jgi:hypothetical protein
MLKPKRFVPQPRSWFLAPSWRASNRTSTRSFHYCGLSSFYLCWWTYIKRDLVSSSTIQTLLDNLSFYHQTRRVYLFLIPQFLLHLPWDSVFILSIIAVLTAREIIHAPEVSKESMTHTELSDIVFTTPKNNVEVSLHYLQPIFFFFANG